MSPHGLEEHSLGTRFRIAVSAGRRHQHEQGQDRVSINNVYSIGYETFVNELLAPPIAFPTECENAITIFAYQSDFGPFGIDQTTHQPPNEPNGLVSQSVDFVMSGMGGKRTLAA